MNSALSSSASDTAPAQKPGPSATAPAGLRPAAGPARLRRRHLRLGLSFALLVLLPFVLACGYLWIIADDRYSSTTGFTVRSEDSSATASLLGGLGGTGLSAFPTSPAVQDGDILYAFIRSQELVSALQDQLDLRGHYSAHWESDPVFALHPAASQEDLLAYWRRNVQVSYDQSSGLIEVRVLAYDPQMARAIARAIVARGQAMINALSEQARADALRYAQADLDQAVIQLKAAREALTRFRSITQVVDPEADLQGRMGVMNNLQQQLAEALIEHDLLLKTASSRDARVVQAARRITVIRDRIQTERSQFAGDGRSATGPVTGQGVGPQSGGEDYPKLLGAFEILMVDREVAEESYRAALTALELARASAVRQSRYLATYLRPTLAEVAEFPRRLEVMGLILLFLTLFWAVLALIYYSIRDRA